MEVRDPDTGPATREAQRGFLAARVRRRQAPGTGRAGGSGLPGRVVSSHTSGRRGHPRPKPSGTQPPTPGTPRRSVGGMRLFTRSAALTSASSCRLLVAGGATQPRAGTRSRSPRALARSVRRGSSSSSGGGRSGAAGAGRAHGRAGAAALQARPPTPMGVRGLRASADLSCFSFLETGLPLPGSVLSKSHGSQQKVKECTAATPSLLLSPPRPGPCGTFQNTQRGRRGKR